MENEPASFRNRIVGYDVKPADQFLANPLNFRRHPQRQRTAVAASLEKLGWVDVVIENVRTGNLIDGHDRVFQAMEHNEPVPYIQVDLSDDEEKLALMTLDAMTGMAIADKTTLDNLHSSIKTSDMEVPASLLELMDAMVLQALDYDMELEELQEAEGSGDGELLERLSISIEEPATKVEQKEVWALGEYCLMVVADVISDAEAWLPHAAGRKFFPYAGPLVPIALEHNRELGLIVQPDAYVAGHIVDRYIEVGEGDVGRV